MTIVGAAVMTKRTYQCSFAVLIPCCNEELTISTVVYDFRRVLPEAIVYVYDNNSDDRSRDVARAAGAMVGLETMRGKGNVIRRMFADIEADIYVMVDGDEYIPMLLPRPGSFPPCSITSSTW